MVVLGEDLMDDFFEPARDELSDWNASVEREWENWERAEKAEDLGADWWPPQDEEKE